MREILGLLLFVAGSAAAVLGLYLSSLALAYLFTSKGTVRSVARPPTRLAVLVPAHNEEQLIARCIKSLSSVCRNLPRS